MQFKKHLPLYKIIQNQIEVSGMDVYNSDHVAILEEGGWEFSILIQESFLYFPCWLVLDII